jgi:hypothetical protein
MVASDNPDRAWIIVELGLAALLSGHPDVALERLDESLAHGLTPDSVNAIRSEPAWNPVRDDDRFVGWLTRAGSAQLTSADVRQPR